MSTKQAKNVKWAAVVIACFLLGVLCLALQTRKYQINVALFREAWKQHPNVSEMQRLLAQGADVEFSRGKQRMTPLHAVTYTMRIEKPQGDIAAARFLLQNGANVNAVDSNGETPLIYASRNGDMYMVELLLSKGAGVHIRNDGGKTALQEVLRDLELNPDRRREPKFVKTIQLLKAIGTKE